MRVNLFLKQAQKLGLGQASKDELLYWGYFNYQNPAMAQRWLTTYGKSLSKSGALWQKSQAQEDRPAGIPAKSLKRVSTARYLEENRFMEDNGTCDLNFFKK